jgi:putative membrane protein
LKRTTIAFAVLGLLLGTLLIAWFGAGGVVQALLSVGWGGFALYVAWQFVLFAVLGLAWTSIMPAPWRRPPLLIWGRMVRDAATTCLPFSPIGGFVFGGRALSLHGVSFPVSAASTIVDVTAEVLAQICFAALALILLIARDPDFNLALPLAVGLAGLLIAIAAFFWVQRGIAGIFARLGRRIAGEWFDNAQERLTALQAELALIHGHTGRLALGFSIHMVGWIGTGIAGWIAYRLLGTDLELSSALIIEGLLHAAFAIAFVVPANVGVQEAMYAALGALFGVPVEISLGVSLLRRARDLVVGVPILLIWQLIEMRRLRAAPKAPAQTS